MHCAVWGLVYCATVLIIPYTVQYYAELDVFGLVIRLCRSAHWIICLSSGLIGMLLPVKEHMEWLGQPLAYLSVFGVTDLMSSGRKYVQCFGFCWIPRATSNPA